MFGVLFEFPTATSMINGIGEYSSPWFSEMIDYIWPILGLVFVAWLISKLLNIWKG